VDSVIEFIQGPRPTLDEIHEHGERLWAMSAQELLEDLAERLRPIAREVFGLFRNDAPPERRLALATFLSG